MSPAMERQVLNHLTVRRSPVVFRLTKAQQIQSLHLKLLPSVIFITLISLCFQPYSFPFHPTSSPSSFHHPSGTNRLPYSALSLWLLFEAAHVWSLSQSAGAVTLKYHRWGHLDKEHLILVFLEARKSQIKGSVRQVLFLKSSSPALGRPCLSGLSYDL